MRVLVTGAAGFVGSNLVAALREIVAGHDRRSWLAPLRDIDILELDYAQSGSLYKMAAQADCVVHLAGINRAQDPSELEAGNRELSERLVAALETAGNPCPVLFTSSAQATLTGRFANSPYGRGKRAAEEVLSSYASCTGMPVRTYRMPGVFGKWCKPNYNSVVATFCHNAARGLPLEVHDPSVALELVYIDDVVDEFLRVLVAWADGGTAQNPCAEGGLCTIRPTYAVTVGELAQLISSFAESQKGIEAPDCTPGSFALKLRATFESYLPSAAWAYALACHRDERGGFAELLRTPANGQVSLNICKPGQTKGNHWHHTKWERFIVVSGRGLIRLRAVPRAGAPETDEVQEFEVTGEDLRVVEMPPGYTHSITNLSATHDLVFVIWSNETFDPGRPDTFSLEV